MNERNVMRGYSRTPFRVSPERAPSNLRYAVSDTLSLASRALVACAHVLILDKSSHFIYVIQMLIDNDSYFSVPIKSINYRTKWAIKSMIQLNCGLTLKPSASLQGLAVHNKFALLHERCQNQTVHLIL